MSIFEPGSAARIVSVGTASIPDPEAGQLGEGEIGAAGHPVLERSWLIALGLSVPLALALYLLHAHGGTSASLLAVAMVLAAGVGFCRLLGLTQGVAFLLLITALLDRYTLQVHGVDLRGELVAVVTAGAVLVFPSLKAGRLPRSLIPRPEEWVLAGWLAVNLVSSLLFAPHKSTSLKLVLLLTVLAAGAYIMRRLIDNRADLERLWTVFLVMLMGVAGFGLVAYALYYFGITVGASINPANGQPAAFSTLWEPNVFGAFSAYGALMWAFIGSRYFSQRWSMVGLGICLAAAAVSFTRSVWVAIVIFAIVIGATALRRRVQLPTLAGGGLIAFVLLMGVWGLTAVAGTPTHRGQSAGGPTISAPSAPGVTAPGAADPSQTGITGSLSKLVVRMENTVDVLGRVDQFNRVGAHFRGLKSFLLGTGTGSYGQYYMYRGQPEWIASLPLRLVNDTGVAGLLVFGAFGLAVARRAWLRRRDPLVVASGVACLLFAVVNISTEMLELMVSWVVLGLLLIAIDVTPGGPTESTLYPK